MSKVHRQRVTVPKHPEVGDFDDVVKLLQAQPAPSRSRQAHSQTWEIISERIESEKKGKRLLSWRIFALAPAFAAAIFVPLFMSSQNALPGDLTYSLKRGVENAQITFAFSDASKANDCSNQMKRRANELARLADQHPSASTVTDLTTSILGEAQEFQGYINTSGQNQDQLQQQRQRDIAYVIAALHLASSHVADSIQQKIIQSTIEQLQKA